MFLIVQSQIVGVGCKLIKGFLLYSRRVCKCDVNQGFSIVQSLSVQMGCPSFYVAVVQL